MGDRAAYQDKDRPMRPERGKKIDVSGKLRKYCAGSWAQFGAHQPEGRFFVNNQGFAMSFSLSAIKRIFGVVLFVALALGSGIAVASKFQPPGTTYNTAAPAPVKAG